MIIGEYRLNLRKRLLVSQPYGVAEMCDSVFVVAFGSKV